MTLRKISKKQRIKNAEKAVSTHEMHNLFRAIWDEREDEDGYCYCFETGRPMHGSIYRSNTCCYDHVLEKNSAAYPQYSKVKKNIIIVHPDIHALKGSNIDKTPKIKKYKDHLLSLHEQNKLED